MQSHDLRKTFAVITTAQTVDPVDVTPDLYPRLDADYDGFKGHVLVAEHAFEMDWGMWEIHPHGDEIVMLLEGEVEFRLRLPDGEQSVKLSQPSEYAIVPANTWHTAKTSKPSRVLFLTPGEGTQHRTSLDE